MEERPKKAYTTITNNSCRLEKLISIMASGALDSLAIILFLIYILVCYFDQGYLRKIQESNNVAKD